MKNNNLKTLSEQDNPNVNIRKLESNELLLVNGGNNSSTSGADSGTLLTIQVRNIGGGGWEPEKPKGE